MARRWHQPSYLPQSRDASSQAGETWGERDLSKVKKLIDMGFRVCAGRLNVDTALELFRGVDVYTFITVVGITEAADHCCRSPRVQGQDPRDLGLGYDNIWYFARGFTT